MTIKEQIIKLFKGVNELTVKEIVDKTGASKQMVHIAMKQLLDSKMVEKLGRTPKTIYRYIGESNLTVKEPEAIYHYTDKDLAFIDNSFMVVTESGVMLEGLKAFEYWCQQRKLPVKKTLDEFIDTKKKYAKFYDTRGNINGTEKLKTTTSFEKIWLDELYYLDFYAIERFGKTKLGTILHYAKQGQNKFLMKMMMNQINTRILDFIKSQKADAIGFIPPTIRREVQIMKYIQTNLEVPLPVINIKKISGLIPVPQKSLSKIDERIRNAENTFAIAETRKFKHLVLIDDAVGSGATLNQVAGKIKAKKIAQKITGLAIVGSFKGFDVITDI